MWKNLVEYLMLTFFVGLKVIIKYFSNKFNFKYLLKMAKNKTESGHDKNIK